VRGEIIYPEDLELDALKKLALKGKIVLVDKDTKTKNGKYLLGRALDPIAQAGALAVLNVQTSLSNVHAAHAAFFYKDLVGPLPMLDVGLEDGVLLKRLAGKGPVVVEAVSPSAVTGPTQVPNVVAEIRGREKPDEWVIVGAHLDAWDFATGAQDNGTGVAEVLDAARAIKALGAAPRRSIRFALWGGEEQGLYGSRAYAATHAAELDRAILALNTDYGGGAPNGWHTLGRGDVKTALKPLGPTLEGLGGSGLDERNDCGSDHCTFMLAGVPSLELDVDGSKYDEIHHLPSDTLDKVNASNVARAAAVVAVTAWLVADAPSRPAARLSHAQVAEIIKKDAELAAELEFTGAFK
jgi:Zn-dependent M28 family amino/carboxypeptidase